MTTVAVVTVARSDFSYYRPILRLIEGEPGLDFRLIAAGVHFDAVFGRTVEIIEAAGFAIAERLDMSEGADTPAAAARAMARGLAGFSEMFERDRPDVLLVLGDRFETMAAVASAMPFLIPVAHIHGGEVSEGAFDDSLRHAITKMSHLHFAATEQSARRILQLGEEPWRVTMSGSPALDNVLALAPVAAEELGARLGLPLAPPPLLVTFHPETLELARTEAHLQELLAALDGLTMPVLFTYPNADPQGRRFITLVEEYVTAHPGRAHAVANLGSDDYYRMLHIVPALVGNSSSGIIEAASLALPAVNVGNRQGGRERGPNVIDAAPERDAIARAIARALDPGFRVSCRGMANPYGDGHAAARIVERLKRLEARDILIVKKFHDLT